MAASYREYIYESKRLLKIGGPLIISQLLEYLTLQQGLFFSGHLGEDELDAVGLGIAFASLTGTAVAFGLHSASSTLMSQHFGSQDKKQVGLVFQKALWFSTLTAILCACILFNAEWILRYVAPSEAISVLAAEYLKYLTVGIAAYIINMQIQTILVCQSITWPIPVMYLLVNALVAGFHCLFLFVFNLGIIASALAFGLSFLIVDVLFVIFIICRGLHLEVWNGWSLACLTHWEAYAKLAIPAIGLILIEWGTLNVITFLTGLVGARELGAQVIFEQSIGIAYMFPYGIADVACVRVGNNLGAMKPIEARTSCITSVVLSAVCGLLVGGLISGLHSVIPYAFTSAPDVIEAASALLPLFVAFNFFDSIQVSLTGVARGCGKQLMASVAEFVGITVIGSSIGLTLLFKTKMLLKGLWLGLSIGSVSLAVFFSVYFWQLDWHKEAKETQLRIQDERTADMETTRILDEASAKQCDSELPWKAVLTEIVVKVVICLLLLAASVCLSVYVRPKYPVLVNVYAFNNTNHTSN